jgi:hypothetical protein
MSRIKNTLLSEKKACGAAFAVAAVLFLAGSLGFASDAPPIRVLHPGGSLHGYLVLKSERGELLANGELLQFMTGPDRLKSELTFRFKDGSWQQEITIFSQRHFFHLLSDHLVQKGPAFKQQMDEYVNAATGDVTVRYQNEHEEEKVLKERMVLPANLANGLVPTLLENFPPKQLAMTFAMVVATPKPRIVKLDVQTDGEDTFAVGETTCKAHRYLGKVDIGGLTGVIAGIAGKQPPDSHFWIVQGAAPLFLKSVAPQFSEGPLWEIDVVSPTGPKGNAEAE